MHRGVRRNFKGTLLATDRISSLVTPHCHASDVGANISQVRIIIIYHTYLNGIKNFTDIATIPHGRY